MTTTRFLPGVVLAVLAAAGSAAAQTPTMPRYTRPGSTPALPTATPSRTPDPITGEPMAGELPPGRPPAAASLAKMTAPTQPPGPDVPDPLGTLNGPGPATLPPGAYASPWYTDGPGCCGPVGRNGPVEYELVAATGPDLILGKGRFVERLNTGWTLYGGGRSLFYNRAGDAAWAIDLGLSYQYNRGTVGDFINLDIRQPSTLNGLTGTRTERPDVLTTSRIRALHRTAVNFAIGRDWWAWGPGAPGTEAGWNIRSGVFVGGRWGTAHVDVLPDADPKQYARRQKVFEGVFGGIHFNAEVPFGSWIWCAGLRAQYGYDFMNIVPPIRGDVQYLDLLVTTGWRF